MFLQVPSSGVVNANVSPQPIVAIEDGNGDIAAGDVSSVTLSVLTYSGSASPTPQLSNTCSGIENNGVVAFGNCSLPNTGTYTLQASDSSASITAAKMAAQSAFTVTTAPPAKFVLTSGNNNTPTGTASNTANIGPITVTEYDAYNNVTSASSPLTVNLSSSSSQGIFAATSQGTPVTSVTIPGGSSSTTFYYGDTVAGSPTLTAASPGLLPATMSASVAAGPPTQLAFTSSAFVVAQGTSASNPFTIAMEDQYGNLATSSSSATTVALRSTSGTAIFSATANGSSVTSVSIPKGSSSVTAYYGDNTPGTPTITTSATGLTSATQTETILLKPTKLVFSSTVNSGTASSTTNIGPITVTEEAANGSPTILPETVSLTSTSSGKTFSNTAGSASITSVSIPAGQSSATFWYGDKVAASPTITGAATGLTSATMPLTITPAAMSQFLLTPSAPNPTAGTPFTEAISAADQFSNVVTTYTGTQTLSFTGPGNSPAPANAAPSYPASVTFVNGVASGTNAASITLYDAQTTTLTVSQVNGGITSSATTASFNREPGRHDRVRREHSNLAADGWQSVHRIRHCG